MNDRIPDWKLERYRLGELPSKELEALRQRIQGDPDASARLAELDASDRQILAAHPRLRRSAAPPQRRMSPAVFAVPLALAAALGLFILTDPLGGPVDTNAPGLEPTRLKGDGPALFVHRRTGSGEETLESGDLAKPGDRLQLAVRADDAEYGVVVSIDGRGGVTLHTPGKGEPTNLTPGTNALPNAFQLDDAPRFERFVLITSHDPINVDDVLGAASKVAGQADADVRPLPLAGIEQTSIVVRKEQQ